MAVFSFKAYNDQGRAYQSKLEAPSIQEAKKLLIEKGVQLVQITQKKHSKARSVPLSSVLNFTRELLQLIEAGLPLFESLSLLKEQFAQDRISDVILSLSESLESGSSLSSSLAKFPKCFSSFYCTLIQVGEQSGHLDQALRQIVREYERQHKLKKQVTSTLLYPSILLVFCFILIHLMILYIVPSLENLFEGSSNHGLTQTIISLSHHLKRWEGVYLISGAMTAWLLRWRLKSNQLKPHIDLLLLKLPLVKSLILDLSLSKFSSTMEMLLKGGVPLLESLNLAKGLVSNLVIKKIIHLAEKKIEEGEKLSEELQKQPHFPPLFSHILKIGETSGELSQSFGRLATVYEESVEKKLSKLMTLLSPIILLIMGVIIGAIMLGILIPLTDINSIAI